MSSPGFPARSGRWPAALAAGLLWALAAASLALWWLHLPQAPVLPGTVAGLGHSVGDVQERGVVERALGRTTQTLAAPDIQKRFALLGVIASESGQGSALLTVDGQPARAFLQGQVVADGWRLSSLDGTGVRLEPLQSGPGVALTLPQPR